MNKKLLSTFLITRVGDFNSDVFLIRATDKTYELLNLEEKEEILFSGAKIDTIAEHYYRTAMLTFISTKYNIDGLVRISRGNSHDASDETEVIIFKNGGLWAPELNDYRNREGNLYEKKPEVINMKSLSKKLIEIWSQEYNLSGNGERERFIYCSDSRYKMLFQYNHTYLYGTPLKRYNFSQIYEPRHLCLKRVK